MSDYMYLIRAMTTFSMYFVRDLSEVADLFVTLIG